MDHRMSILIPDVWAEGATDSRLPGRIFSTLPLLSEFLKNAADIYNVQLSAVAAMS